MLTFFVDIQASASWHNPIYRFNCDFLNWTRLFPGERAGQYSARNMSHMSKRPILH